jgi:hypothetical protein
VPVTGFAVASIGLAYTSQGGATYNVVFQQFTDTDLPRSYDGSVAYARSTTGTNTLQGPASRQKNIWAISAHLSKAKAKELDDMFKAWDGDRATGKAVGCGLTDETLFDPLTTTVIISTPPSFTYLSPTRYLVAIGLTEL